VSNTLSRDISNRQMLGIGAVADADSSLNVNCGWVGSGSSRHDA
jgi:hypothetical protein